MNAIIFTIFIFILIFSPLAFGTVEPWSLTIMETCSFFAIFLLFIRNVRHKDPFFYEIPGIIPLIFLLLYVFVQIVPLPVAIIKIVSPETYTLYNETVFIDQPVRWASFSINTKATLSEFIRIASYVAFYSLTIQLLTKKKNLSKTVTVIVIFASLLALFGILQHSLPAGKIYWIRKLTQGGTFFGPYVNRNHYAGLMGMLFPVVLTLFLFHKPRISHKPLRDKITEVFNMQKTNIYMLLGFSAVLVATSIFLTLSRSGIVSLCVSMIFFGIMYLAKGTSKKRGIVIIAVFVLIVLSVGWFGWAPIFERFEKVRNVQGDISELRLEIWKDSVNIIKDFLLTGTGFGTFIDIYPKYRTIQVDRIADHAHNDYLELFSDGGAIAFLICVWFLLAVLYKSYKVFLKRREIYSIYLFIASIAGIISILIHSTTDFNLHIGANGLYFFFLSGLAVSAANTRLRDGLNITYLRKTKLPVRVLAALIFVIFLGSFIFNTGVTAGRFYFSSIKDIKLNEEISHKDIVSVRETAYRASFFDPLESQYHYAVANTERILLNNNAAITHYKKSVQLNPADGEYLQRFGLIMSELKKYKAAERLLQAGMKYDISNPLRYKRYALWLFSLGRKDEGIKFAQKAISLEPQKTREYITFMVLNRLDDRDILRAMPERVEPHLIFADYLYRTGKDNIAGEEYLNALQYIKNEDLIQPSFFYAVYNYYCKKGLNEDALKIMRRAKDALPNDTGIRLTIAGLYEKLNMSYKAIEEYKQALAIDPKNREAKRKLDNIMSR